MRYFIYSQDILLNFNAIHKFLKTFNKTIYYFTNVQAIWDVIQDTSILNNIDTSTIFLPSEFDDNNNLVAVVCQPKFLKHIIVPSSYTDVFVIESCCTFVRTCNCKCIFLKSSIKNKKLRYSEDNTSYKLTLPDDLNIGSQYEKAICENATSFCINLYKWPYKIDKHSYSKRLVNFAFNRLIYFKKKCLEGDDRVVPIDEEVPGDPIEDDVVVPVRIVNRDHQILTVDGIDDDDVVVAKLPNKIILF